MPSGPGVSIFFMMKMNNSIFAILAGLVFKFLKQRYVPLESKNKEIINTMITFQHDSGICRKGKGKTRERPTKKMVSRHLPISTFTHQYFFTRLLPIRHLPIGTFTHHRAQLKNRLLPITSRHLPISLFSSTNEEVNRGKINPM